MPTTRRYLQSTKNLDAVLAKIVDGAAPAKFTVEHLKQLGFNSSNDRSFIPVLKDLGFLSEDGTPTQRYHEYRDVSRSKLVLGQALKDAYPDIFYVSESPSPADREAIRGKFKSMLNVTDPVADKMLATFYGLLSRAQLPAAGATGPNEPTPAPTPTPTPDPTPPAGPPTRALMRLPKDTEERSDGVHLHYNIQIHLPATRDIEVFNSIFKSLKDNLL